MNRRHSSRPRRHFLATLLALALLAGVSNALASRGDPVKQLVPADQVRAKAMLVRKSDLGQGFKTSKSSSGDDTYCKALDESDLVLTGDAESPTFTGGVAFVSSGAQVYATRGDANTSWRQGTSAAGEKCVRSTFRDVLAREGGRLVSFHRLAFPHLAERSIAYRAIATSSGVHVYLDLVMLQRARAQAGLFMGAALSPVPRSDEVQLASVVAGRMATAMGGS